MGQLRTILAGLAYTGGVSTERVHHSFFTTTTMSYDNATLPDGWIREIDPNTQHPFWVRTTTSTYCVSSSQIPLNR